jgi:Zn-dependent metalloprotease/chitodextrinase
MKNKISVLVVFLLSTIAILAQEKRDTQFIQFEESSKHNPQEAIQLIRENLKLSSDDDLIKVKTEYDRLGFSHEEYQQYFKGIKVEFGTYKVHSKNGSIQSMNGELFSTGKLNVSPSLSNASAFQRAIQHTGAEHYMWEYPDAAKEMDNYQKPVGELVVLAGNVIGRNEAKLAYKFDIFATYPISRGDLYVDAHNGEILFFNAIIKHATTFGHIGKETKKDKVNIKEALTTFLVSGTAQTRYSGTQSIETTLSGSSYILSDAGRKVYTRDALNQAPGNTYPYVSNYSQFTDNDNNWTTAEHSANKDNAALDAHWGAMETFDYWQQKHGRNSYDNNGAQIRSYVHVDNNYDNAFWNGSVMSYGDGSSNGNEGNGYFDALTSIDVAGHEIGHAVCTYTANLAYQRESGGMNEGFSDIWGAAIEHFAKGNGNDLAPAATIWLIGDEIDRRSGSAALRSMSDPKSLGQPDTYGGTYWQNPNCGTPTNANDYCGVHTNSGVLNHWFYLVTAGGSGTNDISNSYSVTGVGITKAANIAYRLESVYLSANSTYANARTFGIQAATDLYGAGSPEVIATTNAFYAVGIGAEYVQTCSLSAPSNFASSSINDNGFTLSWSPVSGAVSYAVTANGTTINVTGTSYIVTGLSPGTSYPCVVKANCSAGGSGTASNINVTTTGSAPLNYCASNGNSVVDEYIGRVQIGTINNATGATSGGYANYTAISTNLTKGSSVTITITPTWTGTIYNEGYSVWIDYNKDGDFGDSGEQVWTKAASKTTPVSGSFTVPTSAITGATRMRVSMKYNGVPTACESFSYGEVEDYTVNLVGSTADTTAPTAPTNLTASGTTTTTTSLSWTASTDNVGVTGYDVYQGASVIATVTGTTRSVTGLTPSTTYSFSVRAKDAAGNVSLASNVVNVTTLTPPDTTAPTAPANLTASGTTTTTTNLSWTASTDNVGVTGYDVYQGATVIATVTGTTRSVTGLTPSATYSFSVRAKDAAGNVSSASNTVNVTTLTPADTTAPTPPTNLTASGTTTTSTNLSWTASTDNVGVTGYDVYQGATVIATVTGTTRQVTGLTANTGYTFSVRAKDAAGNVSGSSNTVNVTTLPNSGGSGCTGGISSFPYNESFETGLGAWTQATIDDLNWTRDSGGTPSSNTGPSNGSNGSWYLFVEASSPNYPSKRAILNSPCFNLSSVTQANFTFDYHMYGANNLGSISVEASSNNGSTWTSIWSQSGASQGNTWKSVNLDLASYVGGSVQLRFNRLTGDTWQADIAIDNVGVSTSGGSGPTCSNVNLSITFDNYPEETAWSIKNASGATVASGGTYGTQPDGSTLNIAVGCLVNGCYDFIITDVYGDGICCAYGNGSYTLTNIDTSATLASGGSFTTSQTTNFCLSAPSATFVPQTLVTSNNDAFEISVYPNPVKGNTLFVKTTVENITYTISNMIGQQVAKGNLTNNSINVEKLKGGLYLIEMYSINKKVTKKFIKE